MIVSTGYPLIVRLLSDRITAGYDITEFFVAKLNLNTYNGVMFLSVTK